MRQVQYLILKACLRNTMFRDDSSKHQNWYYWAVQTDNPQISLWKISGSTETTLTIGNKNSRCPNPSERITYDQGWVFTSTTLQILQWVVPVGGDRNPIPSWGYVPLNFLFLNYSECQQGRCQAFGLILDFPVILVGPWPLVRRFLEQVVRAD